MVEPEVGDWVTLWAGARRPSHQYGVPKHLDGHSVEVLEVLADGRYRVKIRGSVALLPKEPKTRIVRDDEISDNEGNPKDWPRYDEEDADDDPNSQHVYTSEG
jgi:hypothetical protein